MLLKVPKAIENFYDRIISNPGTSGQDIGLLRETFAEDFNTRPNPLNPSKGIESGPFPEGFKTLLASYAVMMPDINFQRLQTLILGDKVVVLTKFSATMNAPLPDFTEFPMYIEDWVTGLQQLLNGTPAPDFGFDQDYLDFDGITGRKITAYENSQKV